MSITTVKPRPPKMNNPDSMILTMGSPVKPIKLSGNKENPALLKAEMT